MRFLSFFLISLLFFNANANSMSKPSKFRQLKKAISENNIEAARSLIPNFKADELNKIDSNGDTLLLLAIYKERYELCNLLIKNGADPNIANRLTNTPLLLVVGNWEKGPNKTAVIEKLLNYGAKTEVLLDYYLHVDNLSLADLRLLFKREPKLANAPINPLGETGLFFAVKAKDLALVEFFILSGADARKVNNSGETPISIAERSIARRMLSIFKTEKNNCLKTF